MKAEILGFVFLLVIVLVGGATGVAAQEVETEIQFEDEVVVGEETTITYVANVVETPMETTVETELTLLINGEEIQTKTTEADVFEGAELRTNFTHTFESAGEKEVTVDSVTQALGQEITDSTTATVTVREVEDEGDGNETEGDGTEDGGTDDSTGGGDDTEDETENGTGDGTGNETDDSTDMDDGSGDRMDDNESDGDTDGEGGDEGLPGFGAVAALISLAVVAVYTRRRSGG